MLSRILWGARISLLVAVTSIAAAIVVGGTIGMVSGYVGGRVDLFVMQTMDVLLSFPSLILGLIVVALLGPELINLVFAIALTAIAPFARIARAPVLSLKERAFIEAGRALGFSHTRILFVHVLPNIMSEVLVMGSLWMATAVRTEASLSFIGLGVKPPTATWGGMMREGFENILDAPWLSRLAGHRDPVAGAGAEHGRRRPARRDRSAAAGRDMTRKHHHRAQNQRRRRSCMPRVRPCDDAACATTHDRVAVAGLVKHFIVRKGFPRPVTTTVRAVDGIDFQVRPGEAFGLVGESGCGKSTAARAVAAADRTRRRQHPLRRHRRAGRKGAALIALRRRMQIVFQDPYSSLNPRRSIGQTLTEPLAVHGIARGRAARDDAAALLAEVGLPDTALDRYPHEFSGGQRQRIGIARALALQPELIVADEPVSALDVSVQAQVLLLLKDLQTRRGLAFVFVSHDLGVIRWFCSRVAVMYLGRIVEQGPVARVFATPRHPYTRMLRDASPIPDPAQRGVLPRVIGEIPSAAAPPPGCHFHPRCPRASDVCRTTYPGWSEPDDHGFACHHPLEDA